MFTSVSANATGMPVLDAQADFRRARRAYGRARVGCWLSHRHARSYPQTLCAATTPLGGTPRLAVVRLDEIVGTLEPTSRFDSRFRPGSETLRHRWERIALAHRRGEPLPPIEVLRRPDGYYVIDGRHRVSVARALGQPDIDAWVTGAG
jgi:hypothetical protein